MEILRQLGANETAFLQFGIFIISIAFLTIFVYGPYFKAYDQRLQQTKGADQVAFETQEETKKLESIFQTRARDINNKIKEIFATAKKSSDEAANTILNTAKAAATEATETARKEIGMQRQLAEKDAPAISQEVANEISKKLMGTI